MIYLDNAATTRPCRAAIAAADRAMETVWYNPSSLYAGGLEAERLLREARAQVAAGFGVSPGEITFTSGGTEGDNTVLLSAIPLRMRHVLYSAVEHDAVIESVKKLEQAGIRCDKIPVKEDGCIDLVALESLLTDETGLVSVMQVNNETGAVQPLREVALLLKRKKSRAIFHTDAVQGFLKEKSPVRSGVDIITVSAHKVHALKGAGAIWTRPGVKWRPLLVGGGQEGALRSGTEAMPAIAAFGAAVEDWVKEADARRQQVEALHCFGEERLSRVPGLVLLHREKQSPYILNIAAPGYRSEPMLRALSDKGIYVSVGSACSKGRISRVLGEMGLSRPLAASFLRLSLSHDTTEADLAALAEALEVILPELVVAR